MIKDKKILFSIIIATYNRAHLISRAIQSVINQSYTDWELIIVDDGSNDNTRQKVDVFGDKKIKYYYQENQGRSAARNFGIEVAKGEYISFLDDDDYLFPNFIEEFYTEINNYNYPKALFMCDQQEIDLDGNVNDAKRKIFGDNPAKFILKYSNNVQPFFISKEILNSVKFDSRYEIGEDFHLLLRLALKYPLYYFAKTLCVYVNHDEMTMERELKELLFLKHPYNRLDVLNNICEENNDLIIKYDLKRLLQKRYNKIAYFYSSEAIKKRKFDFGIKSVRSIKWSGGLLMAFYYKISIYSRALFYKLISRK